MNRKLLLLPIIVGLIAALGGLSSVALADDETIEQLKRQVELLQDRVDELEEQNQKQHRQTDDDAWGYHNRRQRQWDPFAEMDRMQAEMNRMFEDSFRQRSSAQSGGMFSSSMDYNYDIDLKETDNGYEIIFDMQGLDENEVDIQINAHSITIKGEHNSVEDTQGPKRSIKTQTFGSFIQTIPLPVDADTAQVKTEKKGDSLVIKLPKKNT